MNTVEEAAQIFIRMFEALARRNGKTLNVRSRQDIKRACELLAAAGPELDDLFDDLPRETINLERRHATVPPEVDRWREERR